MGDATGKIGSQINQAQALQTLGFYRRARNTLEDIQITLDKQPDSVLKDEATADLMVQFYQDLAKNQTKAEALRRAQLALLSGEDSRYKHPYYWASFILVGNWQ
ncbi:CHAT domain-containing protein [Nostoc sp. PCC 7524]|uniref:CHAT domain-containing protein n=1 Tax=Nostoc sp. (strain ATCC 29411 / PCC 7524) TaxID=28072 RepID=UPI00059F80F8|nr:CHAT domain-containing protein [Nostoc sp. PCC 7524]